MTPTRPLCLASISPRRRELLERFGLVFEVFPPNVDEAARPGEAPTALVARLAAEKARAAHARFPGHLILAGDTVVLCDDQLLGKPADAGESAHMLALLSARTHRVLSGYHLLDGPTGQIRMGTEETRVTFRALSPEWVRWYSHLPEGRDKAGGYAIQGVGGAMVRGIEGSYTNVVGFPIEAIIWDLLEQGWLVL
jgi:septum formation protein